MPLMPKRIYHRKVQRGRNEGVASRNNALAFGDYGLQIMEPGRVATEQIEAMRVAVTRYMKRRGKVWLKIFPDMPVTKKPLETRMGKGKGNPEGWEAHVKTGNILLEMSGCSETVAKEALASAVQM